MCVLMLHGFGSSYCKSRFQYILLQKTNEMHRRNVSTHKPDLSVFWMLQQLSPSLIEKPHLWVVSGKYTCESGCSKTIISMVLQIAISSLSLSVSLCLSEVSSAQENKIGIRNSLVWVEICAWREPKSVLWGSSRRVLHNTAAWWRWPPF